MTYAPSNGVCNAVTNSVPTDVRTAVQNQIQNQTVVKSSLGCLWSPLSFIRRSVKGGE